MWKKYKEWCKRQLEDYSDYIDDLCDVYGSGKHSRANPLIWKSLLQWTIGTIVYWKLIIKGFIWIIKKIGGRHE